MLLSCLGWVSDAPKGGGGNALGWRDVLVLAIEVVLSAELARASFVTLLFSRTAVVTSLGGAHLLSSYLLCGAIVVHVRRLGVGCDRRGVLLGRLWRLGMVGRTVGVRWTHGVVVSIGYAAVGSMLVADCPRLVMAAMLHGSLSLRLDVDTDTDAGGAGTVRLWCSGCLRCEWGAVAGDAVLGDRHRRSSSNAIGMLTR
jgi:hypothetical protein